MLEKSKSEKGEQPQTTWIWNSIRIATKNKKNIKAQFSMSQKILIYNCFYQQNAVIQGLNFENTTQAQIIFRIFHFAEQTNLRTLIFKKCVSSPIFRSIEHVNFVDLHQLTLDDREYQKPILVNSLQLFQRCHFKQLRKLSFFIQVLNISSLRKASLPNLQHLSYGSYLNKEDGVPKQQYMDIQQLAEFQFPELKILQFPSYKIVSGLSYAKLNCRRAQTVNTNFMPPQTRRDYGSIKKHLQKFPVNQLVILSNRQPCLEISYQNIGINVQYSYEQLRYFNHQVLNLNQDFMGGGRRGVQRRREIRRQIRAHHRV